MNISMVKLFVFSEEDCCVLVMVFVTCLWRGEVLLLLSEEEL